MIDINKVKKGKTVRLRGVYIKLPVSAHDFMKKNNLSPTKLFVEALKELGWKNTPIKKKNKDEDFE